MKSNLRAMRFWRLVVAVTLFGVIFSLELSNTQACTGVSYGTRELFRKSSIIVKATVQQVDDFGSNGILRVHKYFKGREGAEYIIFAPMTPPHIDATLKSGYGLGDCAAFHEVRLQVGQPAYFFLKRLNDGSFILPNYFNQDFYVFTSSNTSFPPEEVFVDGQWKVKTPTESDLIQTLEYLSGSKAYSPNPTKPPYPLLAPLWIKTNKGTEYILPVDGGKPIKPRTKFSDYHNYLHSLPDYTAYRLSLSKPSGCFVVNCTAYSRNGWEQAELTHDNIITRTSDEQVKAFLFEPFGRTMAVWKSDTLKINQTIFALADPELALEFAHKALWNQDGSKFAYSDKQGLWLVNYQDNAATRNLLIAAHDNIIPYPRYFSPFGNYLAIVVGENLFTLKLETKQKLPDGVVSPDEHYLLAFEHNADTTKFSKSRFLRKRV